MENKIAKLVTCGVITLALAGTAAASLRGAGSRALSRTALPDTSLLPAIAIDTATHLTTRTFVLPDVIIVAAARRTTPAAAPTGCVQWHRTRIFPGLVRSCD